jgi:3-hydroxyacyl-[acyl-carrier-protein] dehydratase
MVSYDYILEKLPYGKHFRFVDVLSKVDENGAEGTFRLDPELDFYKGHFLGNPVTPGVILTEIMAQIGLVCFGIFLSDGLSGKIALTSADVEFLRPVFPGETVCVNSEKQYFRFNKLKCRVTLSNQKGEIAAAGTIAGMLI